MSTLTPNLKLEKPGQTEFYNVDVFNKNSDILDEAVAAKVDAPYGATPGPVTNLAASVYGNLISLTWNDPLVGGNRDPNWAGAKVVRKFYNKPTGPNDGTTVIDYTVHNAFTGIPLFDLVQETGNGLGYWYRIFPRNENGKYDTSYDNSIHAMATVGHVLWTGIWEVGQTIFIQNINDYKLFEISFITAATRALAFRVIGAGTHYLRGIGGYGSAANAISYHMGAQSSDGLNWTLMGGVVPTHTSGSGHSIYSTSPSTITQIIGLF